MSTIIEILKCGNLELFHSSMIAWLLDATAEHGFGSKILLKFLEAATPPISQSEYAWVASKSYQVNTETPDRKFRYDIEITCEGERKYIIENKTKSIGCEDQPELYRQCNYTAPH